MSGSNRTKEAKTQRANLVLAAACLAFFGGMVGVAYAAVPLYKLFCQVTGYGGTTQRVEQYSDTILDREITIRFDANTASSLPWDFAPAQRSVTMRIGETTRISYKATNRFSTPTRGRASFNVTPAMAGAYFNKVECFCFTDTELKPGETIDMPVVFFIDPAIVDVPEMKNVNTITLSYTFFGIDEGRPVAATLTPEAQSIITDKTDNLGG
jgi:cytochrome c oxidase assembly protein subunit 11